METLFLQRKIKNSPVSKLIQAKINQRSANDNNNIYQRLKKQSEQRRNNKQQEQQFLQNIQKKLTQEPSKVIGSCFTKVIKPNKYYNKSRKLKMSVLSPKKGYQQETKASVSRTSKRTRSMLTDYTTISRQQSNQIITTYETFHQRTKTAVSQFPIKQLSMKQLRNNLKSAPPNRRFSTLNNNQLNNKKANTFRNHKQRKQSFSHFSLSNQEHQAMIQTPLDLYNQVIIQLRKSSKKFQQSMIGVQKQFDLVNQMNQKMEYHFSQLILDSKDFPEYQFSCLLQPKIQQRYKFSSNHILHNVLSKNDKEVQEWIEKQKNRLLRKKGSKIAREVYQSDIISKKEMKYFENLNKNSGNNFQKDKQLQMFLENPEQEIMRIKRQRDIVLQKTLSNTKMRHRSKQYTKDKLKMTEYGSNVKQIKQYQKKKYTSKSIYPPKRTKNLTSSML